MGSSVEDAGSGWPNGVVGAGVTEVGHGGVLQPPPPPGVRGDRGKFIVALPPDGTVMGFVFPTYPVAVAVTVIAFPETTDRL